MNNKRIVFMGTPDFAANVLEGLISNGYNIVGVVTQTDKKIGRKQIVTYSPVKEMALKYNLPVIQPFKIRDEYQEVLDLNPELIITSAYGQIIPKILLDYPAYKCINTHGSLLPKRRGGAPIQRSIIEGDSETGVTIMYMSEGMDEGDILFQKSMPINEDDTNATMFSKLSNLALEMLLEFLPDFFEGKINPVKQNSEEASYSRNLLKKDEFISFRENTKDTHNRIRGLLDNPGAFGVMDGKKYKFTKVGYELKNGTDPGKFCGLENDYLRIDCLDGFIKVYSLKPEGKNDMKAKDFYNGAGKNLQGHYFTGEYE